MWPFTGTICAGVVCGDAPVMSGAEGASDPPVFDGVVELVDYGLGLVTQRDGGEV